MSYRFFFSFHLFFHFIFLKLPKKATYFCQIKFILKCLLFGIYFFIFMGLNFSRSFAGKFFAFGGKKTLGSNLVHLADILNEKEGIGFLLLSAWE